MQMTFIDASRKERHTLADRWWCLLGHVASTQGAPKNAY